MAEPWKAAIRDQLNSHRTGNMIRVSDYHLLGEGDVRKVILALTRTKFNFNINSHPHKNENAKYIDSLADNFGTLYFAFRMLQLVKIKLVTPNVSNYVRTPHKLDNANTFQQFIATIDEIYAGEHPYTSDYIAFKYNEFISIAKPFIKLFDDKFYPVRRLMIQLSSHTVDIHRIFEAVNTLITYYNTFLFPITSCLRYDTLQITGSCWINASLNALLLSNTLSQMLRTIVDNSGVAANVDLSCPSVYDTNNFRMHILSVIRAVLDHTLDPKIDIYQGIGLRINEYKHTKDGGLAQLAIYRIVNAVFPPEYYEFEYVDGRRRFMVDSINFTVHPTTGTSVDPIPRGSDKLQIPSKPMLIVIYYNPIPYLIPIVRTDNYRLESMVHAPTPGHVTAIFKCDGKFLEFDSNNDLKSIKHRMTPGKNDEFVATPRFAVYLLHQ